MKAIRFLHRTATYLVLAVGVVHTLATFYFFDALTERAIWFSGAGLGAIFVAFLNLGLSDRSREARVRRLTDLANLLFMAWIVLGAVATPQLPSFLVATPAVTMALCGLLLSRQRING